MVSTKETQRDVPFYWAFGEGEREVKTTLVQEEEQLREPGLRGEERKENPSVPEEMG